MRRWARPASCGTPHEPSWEGDRRRGGAHRLYGQSELVFCGYGEPTCALAHLTRLSRLLRDKLPGIRLRLNTNGLSDLIHGRPTADELCQVIDRFSISLNAPNAARYNEICRPRWGEESFEAMLAFARQCKDNGRQVAFSVVDVISPEEIEQCRAIARDMGIPPAGAGVRGLNRKREPGGSLFFGQTTKTGAVSYTRSRVCYAVKNR